MIHGYHVIFGTYGFWLPNDPRGSWSDFVGRWELLRYGKATKSLSRKHLSASQERLRQAAKQALKYPPVHLVHSQIQAVGKGFSRKVTQRHSTVWACSILPQHVHLVLGRDRLAAEQLTNLFKGAATKQMILEDVHPLRNYAGPNSRPPSPWSRNQWIVYLDCEEAIEQAIEYVEQNPLKERQTKQHWEFVTPFRGLDMGWVTYDS